MNFSDAQPEHPEGPEGGAGGARPRRPGFRHPPADLDLLRTHPSLTSFAGRGWHLDHVPAASTGVAFAGALLVSLLSFGVPGALLVVLALVLVVPLAASALAHRDVVAARAVLRVARGVLLVWVVVAALFLDASWAEGGTGPSGRPDGAPAGVSAFDPASDSASASAADPAGGSTGSADHPAPIGGRSGGSGKGGAGRHLVVGTT
jgi:hypothetical protein